MSQAVSSNINWRLISTVIRMEAIIRVVVWVEPQIIITLKTSQSMPRSSTTNGSKNTKAHQMMTSTSSKTWVTTVREGFLIRRSAWTASWWLEALKMNPAAISARTVSSPTIMITSSIILCTNINASEIEWAPSNIQTPLSRKNSSVVSLTRILWLNSKSVWSNKRARSSLWILSTNHRGLKLSKNGSTFWAKTTSTIFRSKEWTFSN